MTPAIDGGLLSKCVHCGFCLPSCPTWSLWREEMDSPRGRLHLMEALSDGSIRLNPTVVEHFDRCLGCMACVTSCPSGVRYDRLIEQTRAVIETEYRRGLSERVVRALVFSVISHPARLRVALALAPVARRLPLPPALKPFADLAPSWRSRISPPRVLPAHGASRGRIGVLLGCVQRAVFGRVNVATSNVLAACGYEVVVPQPQGCCGALSAHAGRHEEALRLAKRMVDAFESAAVDFVATNAAGCGSHLKDYGEVFEEDPDLAERAAAFAGRVRDVSELVEDGGLRRELHPLRLRVAYQEACHLAHAQQVRSQPRAMMARVPSLELIEPAREQDCCGSAGIYNLTQPKAARELGKRKAEEVLSLRPDAYVSANPGCLVQVTSALRRIGCPLPAFHPVELLDASLRGLSPREVVSEARR